MEVLPDELLETIKSFLDDRSRRVMRAASTKWFNMIQYDSFVFYFTTTEQLPQIYQRLEKYNFPIKISFKKPKFKLTKADYVQLSKFTRLFGLNIDNVHDDRHTSKEDLLPLTNLTNLQFLDVALPYDYMTNFINASNLRGTDSIINNTELNLMNLTRFQSVWFRSAKRSTKPKKFLFAPMNYLTRLQMNFNPSIVIDEENWKRLSNLKELIVNQSGFGSDSHNTPDLPNLEVLHMDTSCIKDFSSLSKLTSLVVTKFASNTLTLSTLTSLKSFNINWTSDDIKELVFMTALTNLEELSFGAPEPIDENLLQYFNSSKLTALDLAEEISIRSMNLNASQLQRLSLSDNSTLTPDLLRNFTNLTELRLVAVSTVTELFTTIEMLRKLKVLHISADYNDPLNYTEMFQIQKLPSLEQFTLYGYTDTHSLIDYASMVHLPLKSVTIGWPVNEEFFEKISTVRSLEKLLLYNGSQVTDQMIAFISSLTNLTRLAVYETGQEMTGDTLTLLTSLQLLEVQSASDGRRMNEQALKEKLPYLYELSTWF